MIVAVCVVAVGLVIPSAPAQADFHLMKITEIYAGSSGGPNEDAVELQMYQPDQGNVGGHVLRFHDLSNTNVMDCTLPADVDDQDDQDHILLTTPEFAASFAVAGDFTIPTPMIDATGGAICWLGVDCVTWGSFNHPISDADGPVTGPEPTIPINMSIHRNLHDSTLEDGDDTNNSNSDFHSGSPTPSPNGTPPKGVLSCQPPPQAADPRVAALKIKTPRSKAVISGVIEPADPGGRVKVAVLAKGPGIEAKGSPFEAVGKKKDTLDAESKFKVRIGGVPGEAKRCKLMIRYEGQIEKTKTFPLLT